MNSFDQLVRLIGFTSRTLLEYTLDRVPTIIILFIELIFFNLASFFKSIYDKITIKSHIV